MPDLNIEKTLYKYRREFRKDKFFKKFRSYVYLNKMGCGYNEFCVFWDELIGSFQKEFSFLEIGVYKGQVLCLVALLAKKYNLNPTIYGLSPLEATYEGEERAYDICDYEHLVKTFHKDFGVEFDLDKQIIRGYSIVNEVKKRVLKMPKFDIIYIDGGHDYDTVSSDINLAKTVCKKNGFIITDDSSCGKNFGAFKHFFHGHESTSRAVNDFLENNPNYSEEHRVGHLRAFRKK